MLNIVANPSATLLKAQQGLSVEFSIFGTSVDAPIEVTEDDPFLFSRLVSATLNWGDGSPVEILGERVATTNRLVVTHGVTETLYADTTTPYPPNYADAAAWETAAKDWAAAQLSISAAEITAIVWSPVGILASRRAHTYLPGTYNVVVDARNFQEPVARTRQQIITLVVQGDVPAETAQLGTIIGPILPRDAGYPNAQQWNFNTAEDLQVLESSVRMILLTAKGERLMTPDFGTNLASLVFEPDTGVVEASSREEIVKAVADWEPRVALSSFEVSRTPNMRRADIRATFVSKLNAQPFEVLLSFER